MKHKTLTIIIIIIFLMIVVWFIINPPGRFGLHRFGVTVYWGVPVPVSDLYITEGGWFKLRPKSHLVTIEELEGWMDEKGAGNPDYIIIGTGYQGMVEVEYSLIKKYPAKLKIMTTPEAIKFYNTQKSRGKKIIALIHTTC